MPHSGRQHVGPGDIGQDVLGLVPGRVGEAAPETCRYRPLAHDQHVDLFRAVILRPRGPALWDPVPLIFRKFSALDPFTGAEVC